MSSITFRELQKGFRELGLNGTQRVIVHASLSAFGYVRGGAEALIGALTATCQLVLMPSFTPQCQVVPLVGPPNNGLEYADRLAENAEAEMFSPDLPAHADMGLTAETLRHHPGARRSAHPLLSFTAIGAGSDQLLAAQSMPEPLGPLARLAEANGDVLLLGVDHTRNLALHLAEARAGRRQFVRWALTPDGVRECPAIPGCPEGFQAFAPHAAPFAQTTQVGGALLQRLPLKNLLPAAEALLRADPLALLCPRADCARCSAVRAAGQPAA